MALRLEHYLWVRERGEETIVPQISCMTLGESLTLNWCLHFKNWSWYCFLSLERL